MASSSRCCSHLLHSRAITTAMGSYHIVRIVLKFLSSTDLSSTPIILPLRDAEANHKAATTTTTMDKPQGARFAHDLRRARCQGDVGGGVGGGRGPLPVRVTDADAALNYGCGVSVGGLHELREQARLSPPPSTHMPSATRRRSPHSTELRPLSAIYDAVMTLPLPRHDGGACDDSAAEANPNGPSNAATAGSAHPRPQTQPSATSSPMTPIPPKPNSPHLPSPSPQRNPPPPPLLAAQPPLPPPPHSNAPLLQQGDASAGHDIASIELPTVSPDDPTEGVGRPTPSNASRGAARASAHASRAGAHASRRRVVSAAAESCLPRPLW